MKSDKSPSLAAAVCAAIVTVAPIATAKYGGGTGEPNDPYLIATAEHLNAIGTDPNDWDKRFKLMADIDLSAFDGRDGRPAFNIISYPLSWNDRKPFTGVFDGNGHTVSNFTWDSTYSTRDPRSTEYVGLFGYVAMSNPNTRESLRDSAPLITNLRLADPNVAGRAERSYVGALIGWFEDGTTSNCSVLGGTTGRGTSAGGLIGYSAGAIVGCHVDASRVSGGLEAGGLIGRSTGTVIDSYATGHVTGYGATGGLVGRSEGKVARCSSAGEVSGESSTGGLVGSSEAAITDSHSAADVSGERGVGGLVGSSGGPITRSSASGDVAGSSYVGGLVGNRWGGDSVEISDCCATGRVMGDDFVGGLAGDNRGPIVHSYAAGAVSGRYYVGGLVGFNGADELVVGCFWDVQISGQATSEGGIGLTTAEMQDARTYLTAGWDWVGESDNGTVDVWHVPPGGGYPALTAVTGYVLPQMRGLGTPESPYLIFTVEELLAMVNYSPFLHYRLGVSLDLSGLRLPRPPIPRFAGAFDGNGLTISNLAIEGGSYVGLFGRLEPGAVVSDLRLVDVNVVGSDAYIGALAGHNQGTLTCCHSSGAVNGGSYCGGTVGWNGGGTVFACRSDCAVDGAYAVGGLVGHNSDGTVAGCLSTGPVSGNWYVGGLLGDNTGSVTHCLWDIQTSSQTASAGGTGLATAEMQAVSTFLTAGWDFAAEIANGTSQIWQMPPGGGYPVLAIFHNYVCPHLQGLGTPESPHLISNAFELGAMIHHCPQAHYRLVAPVGLSASRWITSVVPSFSGVFDGDGLTISNLTIEGGSHLGLFGRLESGAQIKDLRVTDVDVAGSGECVGGMVGRNADSELVGCFSSGVVTGLERVGGLVGHNWSGVLADSHSACAVAGVARVGGLVGHSEWGSLTACCAGGAATGDEGVGGLVGWNTGGAVADCYSTGAVDGTERVGGLIGNNYYGSVTECYSSGPVSGSRRVGGLVGNNPHGSVAACFWDNDASGQADSAGGSGLPTAEMQTAARFLEAGWDFMDEIENGTDDLWWIDEGRDYPRLWWERGD